MTTREKLYPVDPASMDLAKHFLAGGTAALGEPQDCLVNRSSLARAIQKAVDDWFGEHGPWHESPNLDIKVLKWPEL